MITFNSSNIFWQYPVITEKVFNEQNKQYDNYIGFPWATVIDKGYSLSDIHELIRSQINIQQEYYTCCQHIHFRRLLNLFRSLNITRLYTPHKLKGEDVLDKIKLRPCPLYAVNVEDNERNIKFRHTDVINHPRNILYSFVGAYMDHYISKIRKRLFEMDHSDCCVVENTGQWHFEKQVYSDSQNSNGDVIIADNSVERYNELLLNSRYSLCPSGAGPNSIRFWESLGAGSIPVLLADTLDLPKHNLWVSAIVTLDEERVHDLPEILGNIDTGKERQMRSNCQKLYKHFRNNFINSSNVS